MENMVRVISEDGGIVLCVLNSTEIVKNMEKYHKTSAVVSAALGRVLTAASLMGTWLKNPEDSLTVRVNGGGPVGTLLVVSDGDGNVRGWAGQPVVEIPLRADGKLDVGTAVGRDGSLSVVRDLGLKKPYVGQVPLVSGEIADDITSYYATSEQTPTVCALGVLVEKDLSIRNAGGFLLQLLPGVEEEYIEKIEKNIEKLASITELLEEGYTIDAIADLVMDGLGPEVLERRQVEYRCYCNEEKSFKILKSLGLEELEKMKEESPVARVECHFCDKTYTFPLSELIQDYHRGKDESKQP